MGFNETLEHVEDVIPTIREVGPEIARASREGITDKSLQEGIEPLTLWL